ncbi:hypothetical protein B0H34DRAFT_705284 [Crassisporium funariophilum]|nr:hypothetical protein B0H34DRAFT_705284 [Crassisporium funariophilum]
MTTYQPSPSHSGASSSSSNGLVQDQYPLPTPDDVPTAVHNLLSSTKRLQEVLRLWSLDQATEGDVSDLYVQIGNEFNVTISAFAYHQIDLSDIHSIPAELRIVLEHCLSEDPAPEVLDKFIPDLRQVLFKLLKGLQNRQDKWRLAIQRPSSSRTSSDSR